MKQEAFTYSQLADDGDSFRLLRLTRGTGRELEGELVHTSLKTERDRYESVSYTWGDSEVADTIAIAGKRLGVTLNLSLILRDLRQRDADRVLWVDAICIDQKNNAEKSHQVRFMARVYEDARRVLFCIGRPTEMTDFAMAALQRLGEKSANDDPSSLVETWASMQVDLQEEHFALAQRLRRGLEQMLGQPWFERVWILQEVAKAREALVHCGSQSVRASVFAASPRLVQLRRSEAGVYQPVLNLMYAPPRDRIGGLQRHDLHSLLVRFSAAKASDVRDKIYALLGLCTEVLNPCLAVDYDKPLDEVILDTIAHMHGGDRHSMSSSPYTTIQSFLTDISSSNSVMVTWAAENRQSDVLRALLQKGASLEDGQRWSDLFISASYTGHEAIVPLLLPQVETIDALSVDTQRPYYDWTALYAAASQGNESVVRFLLQNGARADGLVPSSKSSTSAYSPLAVALTAGFEEIVRLLLEHGADIYGTDHFAGFSKLTLLLAAVTYGHEPVVRLLLEKGARAESGKTLFYAALPHRTSIFPLLLDHGADPSLRDGDGKTAISIAASRGRLGAVQKLFQCCLDAQGRAFSLDLAFASALLASDTDCTAGDADCRTIVQWCINEGVDVTKSCKGRLDKWVPPLIMAIHREHKNSPMVRLLLDAGAEIDAADMHGRTAVFEATLILDEACLRTLIEAGADTGIKDDRGDTPLDWYMRWAETYPARPNIEKLLRAAPNSAREEQRLPSDL